MAASDPLIDGVLMNSLKSVTSFIIKIWIEDVAEGAGEAEWRGSITHVPDGERHYLKDLDDIRTFIVPYLQAMGVRFE